MGKDGGTVLGALLLANPIAPGMIEGAALIAADQEKDGNLLLKGGDGEGGNDKLKTSDANESAALEADKDRRRGLQANNPRTSSPKISEALNARTQATTLGGTTK